MPKMASRDRVRRSELPDTLKRSGRKAQRTFAKAHDAAAEQYGEGETFGGGDVEQNTKQELYERARRFGVEGRSKMSKRELANALARKR